MILNALKFLAQPITIWGNSFHYQGSLIFGVALVALIIAGFVYSLVWVYRDARRRGKNGIIVIALILLTGWPGSFLWWLWLRPPLLREETRPLRPLPPFPVAAVR